MRAFFDELFVSCNVKPGMEKPKLNVDDVGWIVTPVYGAQGRGKGYSLQLPSRQSLQWSRCEYLQHFTICTPALLSQPL